MQLKSFCIGRYRFLETCPPQNLIATLRKPYYLIKSTVKLRKSVIKVRIVSLLLAYK